MNGIAVAIAVAATAAISQAPAQAVPDAPTAAPRQSQLQAIADFFILREPVTQLLIGGLEVTYRERLQRDDDYVALEAAYPGIRDAIVAAAVEDVRRALPGAFAELDEEVKRYWASQLRPEELSAFAAWAARPAMVRSRDIGIDVRPGETASAAVDRVMDGWRNPIETAAERAATNRFLNSAEGRQLLPMIESYWPIITSRTLERTLAVTREAVRTGRRAANAYAARLGGFPPFAE